MSKRVSECLSVSQSVSEYLRVSQSVRVCQSVSVSKRVSECLSVSECLRVSQRASPDVFGVDPDLGIRQLYLLTVVGVHGCRGPVHTLAPPGFLIVQRPLLTCPGVPLQGEARRRPRRAPSPVHVSLSLCLCHSLSVSLDVSPSPCPSVYYLKGM